MAVSKYAFQVDRLAGVQRGPLFDLLFQSAVAFGNPKRASNILSDAFKEALPRGRPAGVEEPAPSTNRR